MTHFKQFRICNGETVLINTLNINTARTLKGERQMPIDTDINHPILSKMPRPREDLQFWYVMLDFNNGQKLNSQHFDTQEDAQIYIMRLLSDDRRF